MILFTVPFLLSRQFPHIRSPVRDTIIIFNKLLPMFPRSNAMGSVVYCDIVCGLNAVIDVSGKTETGVF